MLRTYDLLDNVLSDIEKGLRKGINVDILSEKYDVSYRHLQRLFKNSFKQSLSAYIRSRRLVESINDLLDTDSKILDIALDYGFCYEQTYIKAFKSEFGMTPGEFRRTDSNDKAKMLLNLFDGNKIASALFIVYFFEGIL